jgi:hypothetical protein
MLSQLPTPARLPPFSLMLDDIGAPAPRELGRALDVPERQAAAWQRTDSAPRAVMLALYWLTRWGRSHLDAGMVNECRHLAGLVDALTRERATDAARLARLDRLADWGSANAPTWRGLQSTQLQPVGLAPAHCRAIQARTSGT